MELDTLDNRLRRSLLILTGIAIFAISAYFIWFGLLLGEPLSQDTGTWGEFGDFIGGLLNPLVAACALYWLTMSVRLQKAELAATRNELALTRTELTASREAQENQVLLATYSARINALNIELSSVTSELTYQQSRIAHWVQFNSINGHISTYGDAGDIVNSLEAMHTAIRRMKQASAERDLVLEELRAIQRTVSAIPEPIL